MFHIGSPLYPDIFESLRPHAHPRNDRKMQLPPPEVLLTWPAPNYIDPADVRGPQIIIITAILFPITVLLVALRIFTRARISKSFGLDDCFLVAALLPTAACTILTLLAVQRWGSDRHIWDVRPDLLALSLKTQSK
jgi:hypothetical protein